MLQCENHMTVILSRRRRILYSAATQHNELASFECASGRHIGTPRGEERRFEHLDVSNDWNGRLQLKWLSQAASHGFFIQPGGKRHIAITALRLTKNIDFASVCSAGRFSGDKLA